MRKCLLVAMLVVALTSLASAMELEKGQLFLGPTVGMAWSGLGFGANGEYMINKNWGAGGEVSYASYSDDFGGFGYNYSWKYTFVGVLGFASYHFNIKSDKFDPYLKGGLGYFHWGAKYTDNAGNVHGNLYSAGRSSGIGVEGAAGIHYFFKPSMAGRAQIGFPFYFSVGLDFMVGSK